ncbi:MAG: flagellar basal body L-ring protein FlgH [Halanaerobiaceae bacterium]|nr:flagellar basal body L-ring protein FlgH [Halanaerobiaceae bacterium]
MMVRKISCLFSLMIICISLFCFTVTATSLWDDGSADIYTAKKREYKEGDIVTVIIEEASNAVQSANTSTSQDSNVNAGTGIGIFDFLRGFGFSYSDQDNADGLTGRSGSISADLTTIVVNVQPGGNLEIEGTKTIKINGEEQIIKLSGIIRPDDINEDNTISSQKVADAKIEIDGKGVVAEKQRPNIFQRILNWIF